MTIMHPKNLDLPNTGSHSGFITNMLQSIESGLYATKYLTQAAAVVLDTSGTYNWAQIQDAYQFITAFTNRTDFVSTISLGSQFPAGTEIRLNLFSNNPTVQQAGSSVLANVNAALQQIQGRMQDPTDANCPYQDPIFDSTTNQVATRYDMLANPQNGFYFLFSRDVTGIPLKGNPNWSNGGAPYDSSDDDRFSDIYPVTVDAAGNEITGGGFSVFDSYNDHGDPFSDADEHFCVTGSADAMAGYMQSVVINTGSYNGYSTLIAAAIAQL